MHAKPGALPALIRSLTKLLRLARDAVSIARSYRRNRRTLQQLWRRIDVGEQPAQTARMMVRLLLEHLPEKQVTSLLDALEEMGQFANIERVFGQDAHTTTRAPGGAPN